VPAKSAKAPAERRPKPVAGGEKPKRETASPVPAAPIKPTASAKSAKTPVERRPKPVRGTKKPKRASASAAPVKAETVPASDRTKDTLTLEQWVEVAVRSARAKRPPKPPAGRRKRKRASRPRKSEATQINAAEACAAFFNGCGKTPRGPQTLEQWAEVTVENGVTKTRLFPSTEDLHAIRERMRRVDAVCRTIQFVQVVPPEYAWANEGEDRRRVCGCCVQRMSPRTWERIAAEEKAAGKGHLLRTPFASLKTPTTKLP
jgi:hypothetical protein